MVKLTKLQIKRSEAAKKAWVTMRANARKSNLASSMRPAVTSTVKTPIAPPTPQSFTKGLHKRPITAKTVVEKIKTSTHMDFYAGKDRNVLVLYTN